MTVYCVVLYIYVCACVPCNAGLEVAHIYVWSLLPIQCYKIHTLIQVNKTFFNTKVVGI